MKIGLFIGAFCCLLTATEADGRSLSAGAADAVPAAAAPATPATERTQKLLQTFYTDCCSPMASGTHSRAIQRLPDEYPIREAVQKAAEIESERLYDPIIRAQDFDADALGTISVTYIAGDRYAAAYLDPYRGTCVVVPIEAAVRNGALRITDIGIPQPDRQQTS
ncbi:MAG TPA: hypothetical protein H9929_04425 [Candidatus Alistipes excrementavium]|nr:hypothetical protein [Candidatus Alistipes excrementavium]